MKKFIRLTTLIFVTLLMLIVPMTTHAAMPDITAGETYFANGCYILKNNVKVVARGRTMTANEAKVSVFSQKVWARGNVTLIQDGIKFNCDSIYVQGQEKTVDVLGNVNFAQDKLLAITSDIAKFSWSTKVADFYGNVKIDPVDGAKLNFDDGVAPIDANKIYSHIQYNVIDKKIMLLEEATARVEEKVNLPELRIEI